MDAARAGESSRVTTRISNIRASEDRDHAIHSTGSIRRSLHAGQKSNVDSEIGNGNANAIWHFWLGHVGFARVRTKSLKKWRATGRKFP
jgi:hypothetical protein